MAGYDGNGATAIEAAMLATADCGAVTMDFDVSLDLLGRHIPPGMSDADAAARVRAAVEALPGVKYLSLEVCRSVPGNPEWLRLYKPGSGKCMSGGE